MKITFLGTGYAAATEERDNTYLLIGDDDDNKIGTIMVDVGGSPLSKLKKEKVDLHSIKYLIFTHFHIDHIYGLPSLLWGMWLEGRKDELIIYCEQDNEKKLRDWLNVLEVNNWSLKFNIVIQTFHHKSKNRLFTLGSMTISTIPAKHAIPTVGIELKKGDKICVYSSDTEPNEWIKDYERIDLLIHECTMAIGQTPFHTSLKYFLEYYNLHSINKIVFVHLSDQENYQSVMETHVSKEEQDKMKFASDLMTVSFDK
ncbi:MBL fold metallo-hydrolase [Alkalihalobacillus sp. 1P02AB]|uniref:MBL fold metallo-hydrolase n=1 Tax=Alkalihalobacillus sp. 1P02AB TaxID=3132260 RepID=UPI0039A628D8